MKVNLSTKYNAPKFKSISIVQVPKKAFPSTIENPKEVNFIFGSVLEDFLIDDKKVGFFDKVKAFLLRNKPAAYTMLEKPSNYCANIGLMKNDLPYGLDWFRLNSKLPISEPMDKDCFSFFVCTKKDASIMRKTIDKEANKFYVYKEDVRERYSDFDEIASAYAQAKVGVKVEEFLDERLKKEPAKTFKLQKLDELGDIVQDLDI